MKQLSKALAIALMVACAVAFMPLLNGQAFAAAKKPKKAQITSFTQNDTMTADGYTVTAKWKAAKNAKKYKVIIKEDGTAVLTKTVKKKTKSISYAKAKIGSTYVVSVQSINGKKKAKAATKSLTVADKRAALESATISLNKVGATMIIPGDSLTASVKPADATVTYKWFRIKGTTTPVEIQGATAATYTVTKEDIGYNLAVTAEVAATDLKYTGSASATTDVAVSEAPKADFYSAAEVAVEGTAVVVTKNPAIETTGTITYVWKVDGTKVATTKSTQPNGNQYSTNGLAGKTLTCDVTYRLADATEDSTVTVDFGKVASDLFNAGYDIALSDGTTAHQAYIVNAKPGTTITASLEKNQKAYAGSSKVEYTWEWDHTDAENKTTEYRFVGDTFAIDDATKADNTIVVTAVVTPGEDNYAGTDWTYVTTTADQAKTVTVAGAGAYGNKLTATVTGALGEISRPAVSWYYYNHAAGDAPIWSSAATNKPWEYIPGAEVVGRAIVAECDGVESSPITIEKATVESVVLEAVAAGASTAQQYNVTVKDTNGNELTQNVDWSISKYYAGTSADVVKGEYAKAEGGSASPYTINASNFYGVQIALETTGINALTDENKFSAPVQGKAAKKDMTVAIVNNDDPTGEQAHIMVGDELEATVTGLTAGENATYQWYREDYYNKIAGATGSTYKTTADDLGKAVLVKVSCEGYNDGTDNTTAIYTYASITPTFADAVGGTSTVAFTGFDSVTYNWGYYDIEAGVTGWTNIDPTSDYSTTTEESVETVMGAAYFGENKMPGFRIFVNDTDLADYYVLPEPDGVNLIAYTSGGGTRNYLVAKSGSELAAGDIDVALSPAKTLVEGQTMTAQITGQAEGDTPVAGYQWYDEDGAIPGAGAQTASYTIAGTENGNIYVKVTPVAAYGGAANVKTSPEAVYALDGETQTWTISK